MWKKALLAAVVLVGLGLHVVQLLDGWKKVRGVDHGRDFASYHYAVQVAVDGGDPYDKAALAGTASAEGTRRAVHPFFYPPPFLLTMAWVAPLSLADAYQAWFWVDSLFLLAALLALWWWRPRWETLVVGAVMLGSFTPLVNNHVMGQANLPVVALVAWGVVLSLRGRPIPGGVLVGIACMLKMSPGLLVAWWLVRREWTPAVAACVTAVVLSLLTLPLAGPDVQLRFYTDVLPSLGAGEYNGLTVPIDLFGNHSIPNLYAQIWPAGTGLSEPARLAGSLTNLALVVGVFAGVWRTRDELGALSALGALVVVMLLVPAYTYEHHTVFVLIPWVAVAGALVSRRLHPGWLVVLVPAYVVSAWQIAHLKRIALAHSPALELALQELKFLSLVVLLVACVVAARSEAGAGPDPDPLRHR
ncbi:MAG: DUF2029 domain-containing protein [Proteobacteria bacterium]|nr:DUF2029 domain-containing protein [Pseudomonadota bacterium]MCP4920460.1 DUF2029 domain-containing protein [Pseudomonadota bacterium]